MRHPGLAAILVAVALAANARPPTTSSDIDRIVHSMSLDEKVGQMTQLDISMLLVPGANTIAFDTNRMREAIVEYGIGSIFNPGLGHPMPLKEWHYLIRTVQGMATTETPHKIPILYGIDSIHGASFMEGGTLYPQGMALAATCDPPLVQACAHVSAMETRAAGVRWTFAPVLGVARQPLWPRFPETLGEDPYLASVLGAAEVRGFQGRNLAAPTAVAACMKHYMGYSFPFNGHDRTLALIPDYYLREYFLPPFAAAVRAGVATVMINSGEVNGVPVHASHYLLTDVLRHELGFRGVAVSDWHDVIRLHTWHHVAATPEDAVGMAVKAGLDMSMVPDDYSFPTLLKKAVEDGKIPESRIDESVRRILTLKMELGLFKDPYPEAAAVKNFARPEYRKVALRAAEEAMTLLKNEGNFLPLKKDDKVLVAGPTANTLFSLNGCWSYTWQGTNAEWYPPGEPTVVQAIRKEIGATNVVYDEGVDFEGMDISTANAVADAKNADVVVLCLGENSYAETPGDINDLDLPAGQQALAMDLYATGKPVVLVLLEGRGRIIRKIVPDARAILMGYWPGSQGAQAIAHVLFGDFDPSGKLPFTYNRYQNNFLTYDR
ncbi:MAG: glycoside hydrolase family 3 C-terminal domain-containing protein, partial [Verrucomicrobia bacterium]|nr:glycoside hydrolase family 3 C-terminal domain-containing protein [Verrucomicrobiota bacterium]